MSARVACECSAGPDLPYPTQHWAHCPRLPAGYAGEPLATTTEETDHD